MTIVPRAPRLDLACVPTSVERIPSERIEGKGQLWIKRDDETGFTTSGNKIRKLEFSLGKAISEGAKHIVTCGGLGSNHCRATAFAAGRLGLGVTLMLRTPDGQPPIKLSGNALLSRIAGAELRFIDPDEYRLRDERMVQFAAERSTHDKPVVVIPEGASDATGSLGFVAAAEELQLELDREGIHVDRVVHAVGSGGTTAGLSAGASALGSSWRPCGIPVCDDAAHFQSVVAEIRLSLSKTYGLPTLSKTPEFELLDGYVGEGYDQTTTADLDFYSSFTTMTGILVDPCYTGKALRAALDLVREGERVLFWHTGGGFANFGHGTEWNNTLFSEPRAKPS